MNAMNNCYTLSNGMLIPCVGYGTYRTGGADVIETAIRAGYRYFDTASFYQTEADVAKAMHNCEFSL